MARLATAGAETGAAISNATSDSGDFFVKSSSFAVPTVVTSPVHIGGSAWKLDSATTAQGLLYQVTNFAGAQTYFLRFYLCVGSRPTGSQQTVCMISAGNCGVMMKTTGELILVRAAQATTVATSSVLTADGATYYRVDYQFHYTGSVIDTGELRLNGTVVGNYTGGSDSTGSGFFFFSAGNNNGGAVYYIDDVALNDASGSSETSYPADGHVVILNSISDNARGSNWVAGAGGTTNLFDAVNNYPPVGLAVGSETNTSQVKNISKDTTGNYDVNLT